MLGGIIGPILFSIIATIGVFLYPNYSLISTSISEMETKGAAHKALVDSMVVLWEIAAIPLAMAIHKGIKSRGKLIDKVGPISMILAAIINLTLTHSVLSSRPWDSFRQHQHSWNYHVHNSCYNNRTFDCLDH